MQLSRAVSFKSPHSGELAPPESCDILAEIAEAQAEFADTDFDSATLLQVILERTSRITGAGGAALEFFRGSLVECRAASGSLVERVGMLRAASTDTDTLRSTPSILVVPVISHLRAIAVLRLVARPAQSLNPHAAHAAVILAGMLGAALHHAEELESKRALLAECTRTMEAFRQSDTRFRGAFDNAAIGKALVGLDGRWLGVNRAICNILGYEESELLATDFQTLTVPADLDNDLHLLERLHRGEIVNYQLHKRYIHKQGHQVWTLLNVSIVRGPAGEPLYYVSEVQDMTVQHNTQAALQLSEAEYRATFELAGIGKIQVDLTNGQIIRANRKLAEIMGVSEMEAQNLSLESITFPEDIPALHESLRQMREGQVKSLTFEKRYLRRDGRGIWASVDTAVLPDREGRPTRAVASIQDITARKLAEWLEADRRNVLEMAVKDRPLSEVLVHLARAIERQLGGPSAAVMILQDGNLSLVGPSVPEPWQAVLRDSTLPVAIRLANSIPAGIDPCGITFLQSDPGWHDYHLLAAQHSLQAAWTVPISTAENAAIGFLIVFSPEQRPPTGDESQMLQTVSKLASISIEHHNTTRQLAHLVRHDALTGMPNRTLYEDRLQQALIFAQRTRKTVALFALDIDKFKSINDTYGHGAGDHLLRQFAQRLRSRLRQSDTMARIGGDEFVIVLPELAGHGEAAAVAQKLVESLVEPFSIPGVDVPVPVSTSIGIALFPDHGDTPAAIHQRADMALYRVKEQGRNGYSF